MGVRHKDLVEGFSLPVLEVWPIIQFVDLRNYTEVFYLDLEILPFYFSIKYGKIRVS